MFFWPRLAPVQSGAASTPGSGQGSGGFRCRYLGRFRRVPVMPDTLWGSGGFRCRYLVRFRKFPVQVPGEVPKGYGADTWLGSRRFWCRYLVRFRKFPVQLPDEVPEGVGEDAWWGSGADTLWGSGKFRYTDLLGEDAWWGSGGFRCRYLVRFRRVLVQMLCEIPKGSDVSLLYKRLILSLFLALSSLVFTPVAASVHMSEAWLLYFLRICGVYIHSQMWWNMCCVYISTHAHTHTPSCVAAGAYETNVYFQRSW